MRAGTATGVEVVTIGIPSTGAVGVPILCVADALFATGLNFGFFT